MPNMIRTTIYLPREELKAAQDKAKTEFLSFNKLVRKLLKNFSSKSK
jgi:hypothetical protein